MVSIARLSVFLALCAGAAHARDRDLLTYDCGEKGQACCENDNPYIACGGHWDSELVCVDTKGDGSPTCVACGEKDRPMCHGDKADCVGGLVVRQRNDMATCVCGDKWDPCCASEDPCSSSDSLTCIDGQCKPCGGLWEPCCAVPEGECSIDLGCDDMDDEGNSMSCYDGECKRCGGQHMQGCTEKVCTSTIELSQEPCADGLHYHEMDDKCKSKPV